MFVRSCRQAARTGGEKKRGRMKGKKGLGGSCESKCGREQTKEPRREGKCREMTATYGAADVTPSCRLQVDGG